MTSFEGSFVTPGESAKPIHVVIDLTDERLRIWSDTTPVADWRLDELLITAKPDGFHIRRAGQVSILKMKDDARFAVMLDLRTVPVDLARRMAVYRNSLLR